ncbi:MAG TPA: ATP-binding protein, partial [Roseiflexaceae bacterium]
MGTSSTPSGDQFFRAVQQAIPPGTRSERFAGRAPWIAFTLSGIPDKPIDLGMSVADPDAQRRVETAAALRAMLQGQLAGAQIDAVADPLQAALALGARLAWREYGLTLPAHYPLRFLDDIAGSDLLGPLVAALAPRGTLYTEAQIIVRPANRFALNWGWRGHATALLLRLQAKADYALIEDAKRVEAKLDAAPFEATVRIVAVADGPNADATLEMALNQVAEVLGQYHQRTSHHLQTLMAIGAGTAAITPDMRPRAVHTRAPRFAPPPELLLPLRPWRAPDILTSIEIAGLWHAPSSALGSLIRWLPCTIIAPPPHAYIPSGRTDRIMVGMARRADGTTSPIGPTLRDLRPPLHITAGMGAGKSRALANICQQCVPHGYILLDGKGDDQGGSLAATVRLSIPREDEQRLIIFDILDTDWPIGLNPLAGIHLDRPGAKDQALGQIMAIFARLDPATWGRAPAMKEFVQMATLLILEGEPHPTLAHVKQCLLDAHYRQELLPHCTNPDVLTFWTVTFPEQGETQRSSLHALLRRFSQLLTTETTRYMVSQPASRLNLLDAIEGQLIVLAPLPHVTLGDLASAIGMLLLQQFVRAAFSRPGTDQTRHTYPLIIDELQVFIGKDGDSTDIQNAITQLRGLGIAGIYAHQTLDQLGALKDEMLTNSGSRLMLRTQEPDASTYAKLYAASGITANDIAGQDANEHQYAVLQCDGERTGLFSMVVLPWPAPLQIPRAPYHGPAWQTLVPPDSPDPEADAELLRLIYHAHASPSNV